MGSKSLHVAVLQLNNLKGYVKSVSYKNNTYRITGNIEDAKSYSSSERAMYDIDTITTPQAIAQGYTFIIV